MLQKAKRPSLPKAFLSRRCGVSGEPRTAERSFVIVERMLDDGPPPSGFAATMVQLEIRQTWQFGAPGCLLRRNSRIDERDVRADPPL